MLRNAFMPHLATGLPLQTQWFMQDGAKPHAADVVLDFLHDTFDSRVTQTDLLIVSHMDITGP
jgi:hypothetical protein